MSQNLGMEEHGGVRSSGHAFDLPSLAGSGGSIDAECRLNA